MLVLASVVETASGEALPSPFEPVVTAAAETTALLRFKV